MNQELPTFHPLYHSPQRPRHLCPRRASSWASVGSHSCSRSEAPGRVIWGLGDSLGRRSASWHLFSTDSTQRHKCWDQTVVSYMKELFVTRTGGLRKETHHRVRCMPREAQCQRVHFLWHELPEPKPHTLAPSPSARLSCSLPRWFSRN